MCAKQAVCRWLAGSFMFAVVAAPAGAQTAGGSPRPIKIDVAGGVNLATLTVPPFPSEF